MWNILSLNELGCVQVLRRTGKANVITSGRSQNNTTLKVVSFLMPQAVKITSNPNWEDSPPEDEPMSFAQLYSHCHEYEMAYPLDNYRNE